jgi:PAS domain S-box-containing protein
MRPPDDSERGAALARELRWLESLLPVPTAEAAAPSGHDRISAIVATALLALPSEAVDEAISHALAAIGLQRGVDRAFYYRLDEGAKALVLTHEWAGPEIRSLAAAERFTRLPLDLLPPPFLATLRRGGVLRLPRTRTFLSQSVDELVDPAGDRALALAPVVIGGELLGVAGLATACEAGWNDADVALLQVVANGVARAVERRRIDEALRASEARFRAMADNSPLGIFLAGPDGECLYLNPAGQGICGLSAEEARGQGWAQSLHPEDRARIASRWQAAVTDTSDYEIPIHRFVHKDGQVRSVAVRAVPLVAQDGQRNFLGILEDVTERQRAEQERRELLARAEAARAEAEAARAEVASILSRVSDAFVALDAEGRYTYANDLAVSLTGKTREELIGQQYWALFPELRGGSFEKAFRQALETQRAVTMETQSNLGSGRWYEARIYPSPSGVSLFFEDISDRKRHEEELASDRDYLRREAGGLDLFPEIVGNDPGLHRVMETVKLVAGTSANVLVTGETGTGKELVARAIHEGSPRRERLFVKVNCAAISAGLVESELFGHEKGAFTGAVQRRRGRFELAHGGTLFLDEVGELPLDTQVKLLRVLQEREFERVGGSETLRVDVRLVAATNRNLTEMVSRGQFREDLYYRLAVFPIGMPPLRDRAADIPLLVYSFVRRFSRQAGKRIDQVAAEAMQLLVEYRWPGNVRELQNVIERAVILCRGPVLELSALPDLDTSVLERPSSPASGPWPGIVPHRGDGGGRAGDTTGPTLPSRTIAEVERGYVEEVLAETSWVIEGEHGAARRLGLHPNTLRSRLKRWGLSRPVANLPRTARVSTV